MANKRKSLDKRMPKEEMIELLYEYGGVLRKVADHLGCSLQTVYNYLDVHDDIRDVQYKAKRMAANTRVETVYEGLDILLENIVNDPSNAFKAINLVATRDRDSIYYEDRTESDRGSGGPAMLAQQSRQIAEQQAKIERLEQAEMKRLAMQENSIEVDCTNVN